MGAAQDDPENKEAVQENGLFSWIPGAGDRSRTYDLRITNALLYQLSYTGTGRPFPDAAEAVFPASGCGTA